MGILLTKMRHLQMKLLLLCTILSSADNISEFAKLLQHLKSNPLAMSLYAYYHSFYGIVRLSYNSYCQVVKPSTAAAAKAASAAKAAAAKAGITTTPSEPIKSKEADVPVEVKKEYVIVKTDFIFDMDILSCCLPVTL